MTLPAALTIAGSDSGGGAGIQADLKTFQAFHCYGTSVITAVTAQNTLGVSAVQAVDTEIVHSQLKAVLDDFPVKAAKTGMLFSKAIIRTVRDLWLQEFSRNIPLIVDPVMVSTSGDRLLQEDAETELKELMKLAFIITPNLPEATVLLNREIPDFAAMEKAARDLYEITGAAVFLKGGHRFLSRGKEVTDDGWVTDVFFDGNDIEIFRYERLQTKNTHGTGCTLSAAMTAGLALGEDTMQAVTKARSYLNQAMKEAPGLGQGHGPLNHNVSV